MESYNDGDNELRTYAKNIKENNFGIMVSSYLLAEQFCLQVI